MNDPVLQAELDFTPVPPRQRRTPGRVKNVPGRLYVGKYIEHEELFNFLQEANLPHGEGSVLVVRALLHFRDSVVEPLNNGKADDPELIRAARMSFQPKIDRDNSIHHIPIRLYVDKWQEHREAFEFLSEIAQRNPREGNKTIVRALLHYRPVYRRLQQRRRRRASATG